MRKGVAQALFSLMFLLGASAASQASTITAITLGSYSDFTNGAWTLGFEFSPTTNINVTGLGSFFPTGATDIHGVTIWDTSNNVLATTTVTGTGIEGFEFAAISPLLLLAATDYVIGGNTLADDYAVDFSHTFAVAPEINYIGHVETPCSGVTPCFPGTGVDTSFDDFGANFQFTTAAAVPEPDSIMLLGMGLLAFGLLGWLNAKPNERPKVRPLLMP